MPEFPIYFFNTLKVTLGTLILVLPLSSAAGYALGRKKFIGKSIINTLLIIFIAIPYLFYLVPIYIVRKYIKSFKYEFGVNFALCALNLPLGIIIMQAAYRELPNEIEESAYIDGANSLQIWLKVLTPLVITSIAAVENFTFIAVWEEYMFARTLMSETSAQTLSVGLPTLKVESKSWVYGTLSAALTMSLIPLVLCLLYYVNISLMVY